MGPQGDSIATHTYAQNGAYVVTLSVIDTAGLTGRTSSTVLLGGQAFGKLSLPPVLSNYNNRQITCRSAKGLVYVCGFATGGFLEDIRSVQTRRQGFPPKNRVFAFDLEGSNASVASVDASHSVYGVCMDDTWVLNVGGDTFAQTDAAWDPSDEATGGVNYDRAFLPHQGVLHRQLLCSTGPASRVVVRHPRSGRYALSVALLPAGGWYVKSVDHFHTTYVFYTSTAFVRNRADLVFTTSGRYSF